MRPLDDKECYSYGTNGAASARPHRKTQAASRAKPTPSKWDDAQKWLAGMSSHGRADGTHGGGAFKPHRNSNADDRRLLGSASQNGRVSCSSVDGALEYSMVAAPLPLMVDADDAGETKKMDCVVHPPHGSPVAVVRSVCLRDMGTEMTPIASKEPSRTATPLRASTPVARSPVASRSATPVRRHPAEWEGSDGVSTAVPEPVAVAANNATSFGGGEEDVASRVPTNAVSSSLESRAAAWDEAERAKFTARYKREEVKIQAWENHEKRKAEMEMKKAQASLSKSVSAVEFHSCNRNGCPPVTDFLLTPFRLQMKADQMKARAQERLANRLAATQRVAEEKRVSAEAKLNERAARTSEKANYIRRTGHMPSSFFNFKMTCLCG